MRGEIWWADLGIPFGVKPGFKRPVLVLQSNVFNKSRIDTTIVVSITSNLTLADSPGNVLLEKKESDLSKNGVINVSQISTIDKQRLIEKSGSISTSTQQKVDEGIQQILDLRL